ncbi:MAG: D-glycero-beta-D-manno-heptose-7-phosphate kinase [Sporomusaceae bacterium]|jgi:D-beta-D-heptose 7-phosphate kinase/D-beta-D-heptose 1-phosphate adenosyltransferase|nr:D-glycero-beta-D-manno-heptose-7-phosphate kinase [Sporomusaceae bacterium]
MFDNYQSVQEFLLTEVKKCRVLVVGDVMLDRYYFGEVSRISPEAPVPVNRIFKEKETPGGAANVAHNLACLGCKVFLAAVTGEDENRRRLVNILSDLGITSEGLIALKKRPTTTKLRVIGGHQQMLRLDFEESSPVNSLAEKKIRAYVETILAAGTDVIIISDYGKGLCTPVLCQHLIKRANEANVPVLIDPKGVNWKKYAQASVITPNLKELGEALKKTVPNENKTVTVAAEMICKRFQLQALVVTRSEKGLSLITETEKVHVPTFAQEVFDVSGAGDTVIATLGAALAGGINFPDAARLSNLAAGIVVAKIGTSAVSREELIASAKIHNP